MGKQAGKKTIYFSLLLFYTAKNPAVPKSSKLIIVGALSYLIFPVDLIPDFIPVVGLADDATVIAAAVYKVVSHIDDDVKNKAKQKLNGFFGKNTDYEISIYRKSFRRMSTLQELLLNNKRIVKAAAIDVHKYNHQTKK